MNQTTKEKSNKKQTKQLVLWIGALAIGAVLGMFGIGWLNGLMNFIATVYTRLFQLLAVPTIALAVTTTLASLGNQADTGKIFRHALTYTMLTTIAAAAVGLVLYNIIAPGNLPAALVQSGMADVPQNLGETSYYDHILGVIPNNIVKPFAEGNVLSILMLAGSHRHRLGKNASDGQEGRGNKGTVRSARPVVHAHSRTYMDIAFGHHGVCRTALSSVLRRHRDGIARQVRGSNLRWQRRTVLHRTAIVPLGKGHQSDKDFRQNDACCAYGALHQEFGSHIASHDADSREPNGGIQQGIALRIAHLHNHQHERLRSIHTGYISVSDAERRHGTVIVHNDCLALHLRSLCHRQCRSANGMLLPHSLTHVRSERSYRHYGHHPAPLHHNRHDRDSRKRLV